MADQNARGRFVWYDLMTPDPQKVEPFYKAVTGWGTQVWDGTAPYTMWTAGGAPLGGVMAAPSGGAPPAWLAYIAVPDVDASVAQAQSLGARVLAPATNIPDVGRFAVLADPHGATFAVFTSSSETPGHDGPPALGEFSWHELMTADHSAAFDFYHALFGWDTLDQHDMGAMGVYRMFGRNGAMLGGMFNKPASMPMPPNWLHYVRVESADRAADIVKANGGTVMNGPMEVPGGDRIAQCMDPAGAAFAVHSMKG